MELENWNIIPNIWYHKVLRNSIRPDNTAITILSELTRLYQNSNLRTRDFQITYSKFTTKFNYTYRQLYEALVCLKNQSISRSKRPIEVNGHKVGNFLHVTLEVEQLIALKNTSDSNSKKNSDFKPNLVSQFQQNSHLIRVSKSYVKWFTVSIPNSH